MRSEFVDLAKGNEELLRWFHIAHCSSCEEFTLQPYHLGCKTNHTFCESCTAKNLVACGNYCVKCLHEISTVDGTTFYPHARAILNLLHVKNPDRAQSLQETASQSAAKDLRSGEAYLQQILTLTLNHHREREQKHQRAQKREQEQCHSFDEQHVYRYRKRAPDSSDWTRLPSKMHPISTHPN